MMFCVLVVVLIRPDLFMFALLHWTLALDCSGGLRSEKGGEVYFFGIINVLRVCSACLMMLMLPAQLVTALYALCGSYPDI